MQRQIGLMLAAALITFSTTGCKWFKRHCTVTVGINRPPGTGTRTTVSGNVNCTLGATGADALYGIHQAVGAAVRSGSTNAFDECADFCGDPESDACDQCRSLVAIAVLEPSMVSCQGTLYGDYPARLENVTVTAFTDRGTFAYGPSFALIRQTSSVSFGRCGQSTAEYAPEAAVTYALNLWGQNLVNGYGVRELRGLVFDVPPQGTGAGQPNGNNELFNLAAASDCISDPNPNPEQCGVFSGAFAYPYQAPYGDYDGFKTESPMFFRLVSGAREGAGMLFATGEATPVRR